MLTDYVPFNLGPRGPMLLNLHTDRVAGYRESQRPLVYLVASAEDIAAAGHAVVVFDGHALQRLSNAFTDVSRLAGLDWEAIEARQWADTEDDPDRQRRKQAELLVHRALPWDLIRGVAVLDDAMKAQVEQVFAAFPVVMHRPVAVLREWFYD